MSVSLKIYLQAILNYKKKGRYTTKRKVKKYAYKTDQKQYIQTNGGQKED